MLQVAPVPDVIDVSRLGFRKDGTSIYRPPGEERFVTKEHLDHEQYLVDVARLPVPQRVTAGSGRGPRSRAPTWTTPSGRPARAC